MDHQDDWMTTKNISPEKRWKKSNKNKFSWKNNKKQHNEQKEDKRKKVNKSLGKFFFY